MVTSYQSKMVDQLSRLAWNRWVFTRSSFEYNDFAIIRCVCLLKYEQFYISHLSSVLAQYIILPLSSNLDYLDIRSLEQAVVSVQQLSFPADNAGLSHKTHLNYSKKYRIVLRSRVCMDRHCHRKPLP